MRRSPFRAPSRSLLIAGVLGVVALCANSAQADDPKSVLAGYAPEPTAGESLPDAARMSSLPGGHLPNDDCMYPAALTTWADVVAEHPETEWVSGTLQDGVAVFTPVEGYLMARGPAYGCKGWESRFEELSAGQILPDPERELVAVVRGGARDGSQVRKVQILKRRGNALVPIFEVTLDQTVCGKQTLGSVKLLAGGAIEYRAPRDGEKPVVYHFNEGSFTYLDDRGALPPVIDPPLTTRSAICQPWIGPPSDYQPIALARSSVFQTTDDARLASLVPGANRAEPVKGPNQEVLEVEADLDGSRPGDERMILSLARGAVVFDAERNISATGQPFPETGAESTLDDLSAGQIVPDSEAEIVAVWSDKNGGSTTRHLEIWKRRDNAIATLLSLPLSERVGDKEVASEVRLEDGALLVKSASGRARYEWNPTTFHFEKGEPPPLIPPVAWFAISVPLVVVALLVLRRRAPRARKRRARR